MRKLFLFLLILLIGAVLWAAPKSESAKEKITISALITPLPPPASEFSEIGYVLDEMKKKYPNVDVVVKIVDTSDGSALTMTALLAAGDAPNVYMDTVLRAGAYIRPDFSLPLDGYITDLDQYNPGVLDPYKRDGKVLALPWPGAAQAMAINLDMMAEIGYTVPNNWTVTDFLIMAEKVKQFYGGKKYATGMFAGNQSGDYLINNWFAAFGCEYYKSGDYSRTTILETGGEAVHQFFQELMEAGYIPANSADLVDDDYVLQWARGELAATAFFQGWVKPYFDTVEAQGYKPFRYKFVPFPRAAGSKKIPTYYMNAAIVVRKTGTNQDAPAAYFAQLLNSPAVQAYRAIYYRELPNRKDVTAFPDDPYTAQILDIVKANGIFDVGLTNAKYQATRPQHFPILQKVLNMEISPRDSIAAYEKALNEALSY